MGDGAIYGVAGVIAGAILTGGIDALSQWRERKHKKRAAARVVYSDLHWARDILESALVEDGWGDIPRFEFDDWLRYRDALSDSMPASSFHAVAGTFYGLKVLARIREAGAPFPVKSSEDSLLQVCTAGALVMQEGLTRRDVREMESGEVELEIEPGDPCLAPASPGSAERRIAIFIGPSVPEGDTEMVRVESESRRYRVPAASVQELTAAS